MGDVTSSSNRIDGGRHGRRGLEKDDVFFPTFVRVGDDEGDAFKGRLLDFRFTTGSGKGTIGPSASEKSGSS
jgi:hypothetical protein